MTRNTKPDIGDLVTLHCPEGDLETIDMGVVTEVYWKNGFKNCHDGFRTYKILGKYGKPTEYDEPFWEARIVNKAK